MHLFNVANFRIQLRIGCCCTAILFGILAIGCASHPVVVNVSDERTGLPVPDAKVTRLKAFLGFLGTNHYPYVVESATSDETGCAHLKGSRGAIRVEASNYQDGFWHEESMPDQIFIKLSIAN